MIRKDNDLAAHLGVLAAAVIFTASISVAQAQPATGVIEICKVSAATNPIQAGTPFTFTVSTPTAPGSASATVPAGAAGINRGFGNCSPALTVAAGTVTVTEALPSGIGMVSVTASQPNGTGGFTSITVTQVGTNGGSFTLPPGNVNSAILVTFTNATVPTGFLEICKDAGPGLTGGPFTFRIPNNPDVVVPIGACSFPIQVQAGAVTITELPRAGSILTAVTAFSLNPTTGAQVNQLVGTPNLPAGTAIVNVQAGGQNLQTQAHFVNTAATGQLKICKVAGAGVTPGTVFPISAGGTTYNVPAGVNAANPETCIVDGTFPVGSTVPVVETRTSAGAATFTVASTAGNTTGSCASGTTPCTANVVIGTGITEVTFTNTIPVVTGTGQLKICKVAGPGILAGTNFAFTVTATVGGVTTMTPYTVPAGSCVNDGTFTQGTVVRVAETLQTNAAVTGITVNANGVTTNIANPGTGIAPVTIGSGFTEVNFTNAATATLQVCKIAGSPNLVGRSFNVTVGSTTLAITAAAAIASSSPTNCVTFPGPFLAGQSVTVTEPTPGSGVVTTVSINGAAATTATTTGAFPLVAGANRVVFRNTQNSTLQLCKVAGTTNLVGTTFGFSVSGLGTTLTPSIRATTAGTCITIDGTLLAGTQVTITEPSPGTGVTTTISVNGAAAAAGTMRTFTLAPDANTVRFNNSRKHKDDDKGDNDKGDDDKGDDDGNGRDHGGDGKNGNDDNN